MGTVYNGNLGVSALTVSATYIFERVADKLGIKIEYIFLGSDAKDEKFDELDINGERIEYKFLPMTNYIKVSDIRAPRYRKVLDECDVVIDLGGGDSFTDIYGINRYMRVVFLQKIFPILKAKKFILMPQTIGPFDGFFTRVVANQLMKKIPKIYPRDRQSKDYLDKYIRKGEYHEIIDMAFTLPFKKAQKSENGLTRIGINVSGLLWNKGYTNIKIDYQELTKNMIEHFLSINTQVVLVGHVLTEPGSIEDDYTVNLELKKLYPSVEVAPKFSSPIEAKSFISGLDFFTGARMHACIAAYSSGVPVVPIAYSRKFNGMFLGTLDYSYLADAVNQGADEVLNNIKQGYENREKLLSKINSSKPLIDQKISFLIDDIAAYVSN